MDVSEMQKKLSQWATDDPTKHLVDLYSLLCNEVWLRVAHHKINSNQGRETAGIDGETMSNFNGNLEGNLEILRRPSDSLRKNGHALGPWLEPPHGGISLRRTQIGFP